MSNLPPKVCCHCLLLETEAGLILIDTGIGLDDMKKPSRTGLMHLVNRPRLDENETAIRQIEKLNLNPKDVKHIIMTHLDLDHTGGLPDFPDAKVHVYIKEYLTAINPKTFKEKSRYRRVHQEHSPDWVVHDYNDSESWFGFKCIRNIEGLPSDIVIVPLPGHTIGHCGIAVKTMNGWLFHAGDSYFFHKQMEKKPACTIGFRLFQLFSHYDYRKAVSVKNRIRDLILDNNDIQIFCTHDRYEFENFSSVRL